jgi:phosphoribosylglycinamide formyltransferase 1
VSVPLAVFASGSGSNLQAILNYFHGGGAAGGGQGATNSSREQHRIDGEATRSAAATNSSREQHRIDGEAIRSAAATNNSREQHPTDGAAHVALVVSDRADAGALRRAETAGIPTRVIQVRGRSAADVAAETVGALERAGIELVALAGYLRLVPAEVVNRFAGRIVNIHPALLPAFGGPGMYGTRIHAAVLAAGCTVSGATVHHVDEEYDRGRIIAQWPVPVLPTDDPATLAARVLAVEHRLYPPAIEWLARRRGPGMLPPLSGTGYTLAGGPTPRPQDVQVLIRSETR